METQVTTQQSDKSMMNLEFVDGEAKSYFSLPRNQISTRQSNTQLALLLNIVSALLQPATLCLIATIIYLGISQLGKPFNIVMYAIQLGLLILANIIKHILVDRSKQQADQTINQRTAKVYRGDQQFEQMHWGDIKQGDIVYLQQGQTAPADIIVLDSQQIDLREAITYTDNKNVNGELISQKKKSCYLTQILNKSSNQKLYWARYRKILSGKLTYQKPTADMSNFKAYLKLSRDPKMEKLSIDNLILRESIIKTSLWVYGLVIYPGMDSKIMKNFKEGNKNRSSLIAGTDKLFFICLFVNVLLGSIFSISYHFIGQSLENQFSAVAYHFLIFSVALPNFLYLGKDLFMIMFSLKSMENQLEVRNFTNLQQLGGINYLVISNVGVLNTGKLYVNQIVTESSVYQFNDQENIDQITPFSFESKKNSHNVQSRRRHGSSMKEDQFLTGGNRNFLTPIYNFDKRNSALLFQEMKRENHNKQQEISYQIDDDANVKFKEASTLISRVPAKLNTHLQPLKLNKKRFYNDIKRGQKQANDILKGINLCHRAKLYYSAAKGKYQGVSFVNSQEILLNLLKFIGWSIEPNLQNKKQLGLNIIEQKQKLNEQTGTISFEPRKKSYLWCGINSFHFPRKLYSVVVSQNDVTTLYCKGKPQDIIQRLKISKETQKIIENTISSYQDKQSQIIIYAKRQFNQQQRQIYDNDYISLKSSLTTTAEQIEAFSKQYERDLDFICIIGMSTQIDPKADAMMKQLQTSGIKTCIFSRENSDASLVRKLILEGNCEWKDIRLEHQSIEQIKYYLNEVTNLLHSDPDLPFLLTVSGTAWKTIRENSEVTQHFMFVLFYCQSLLAVKFNPSYIAELTNKIRNSYPSQQKVMGIGSAFTDLKFLGQSNISIGMSSNLPTDIKANSLDKIIDALKLGPYFFSTRLANQGLIFYKVIVVTTILLVLEIISNCQGISNTLDGDIILFYLVIYTCIELFYHIFHFRKPMKVEDTKSYKNFKNETQKLHLICIEAVAHGIFIIISVHFTLPNVRIYNGKILPIQAQDMAIFIILVIVNNLRNLFNKRYSKLSAAIMAVISIGTMTLCTVITARTNTNFSYVASQFSNIFSTYDSITLVVNTSIFCFAFSLFMQEVIKKNLLQIQKRSSKLRKSGNKKSDMASLIKHLYQKQHDMQVSMKQIVQKQMNVNCLKINSFLQIKDEEDNLKFDYHRVPIVKSVLLKVMIVQALFLLILLILEVTYTKQTFIGYEAILVCDIVITVIGVLLSWRKQLHMLYYKVVILLILCNTVLLLTYAFIKNDQLTYMLICFIAVIITQSISICLPLLVVLSGIISVASIIISIVLSTTVSISIFQSIFVTVCFAINLHVLIKAQIDTKISFIITQAFQKQNNYVNDILSILVPKFIKNHLEEKGFALQQQQKKVSILFCYVCNFDEIVKEQGKNVVPLMDELFRQFDQLCHNFAVQKIETVGQTYMAATGIKPYEDQIQTEMKKKNQVQRLLKMAIQMLEKSQAIMWGIKKNKKLKIKIGIHHGNVVIGVIGYHKPQFSLIGDTVNTTSRHCSTAEPGQVVLSEVAYKLLHKFPASAFSKSSKTMKGLGQVNVFRYLNNQTKSNNYTRVRIRFQQIVKKVIENLKKQGKIKYQNYKALQLAQKFVRQRRASKKYTKYSQQRRSVQNDSILFEDSQSAKQTNKFEDLQLKYNSVLQLKGKKLQYIKYILAKNANQDRIILSILAVIYLIIYILNITNDIKPVNITLTSVGLAIFPVMFILYRKAVKNKYINILYLLLHCYLLVSIKVRAILYPTLTNQGHLIEIYVMIQITVCSSQVAFRFLHSVVLSLLSIGLSAGLCGARQKFDIAIVIEIFYLCLVCYRKYCILEYSYQSYSFSQIHEKKSKQQSDLVSQLLPKHAYEKLKNQNSQNRLQLTDRFEKATMLFADIKGFTSYSNQTTPVGVVKMLRELFEQFDKLCLKFNVYKVYTIGDCYVVLGFTNCYQRDYLEQSKNVVNMGLAMVQTIQRVRESLNFYELDMRIGVHTGTIIGGIIGTQIVRYDIYGPDVMVANKFQQFGKIGAIHISEATKQILDQDKKKSFNIVPNGTVKVQKLNAEYNGYLLSKKKFEL